MKMKIVVVDKRSFNWRHMMARMTFTVMTDKAASEDDCNSITKVISKYHMGIHYFL